MWLWPEERHARWVERDRRWAQQCHRCAARPGVLVALGAASRLGDGAVWYALMLLLPLLDGANGLTCTLQMVAVGAFNLVLYATVKRRIGRPRPFVACQDIQACVRALDQFSFPSGHALHAFAYAMLLSYHYPVIAAAVWSFAALVAASRVVLGLHYPSDVAAGAAVGLLSAFGVLRLWALFAPG